MLKLWHDQDLSGTTDTGPLEDLVALGSLWPREMLSSLPHLVLVGAVLPWMETSDRIGCRRGNAPRLKKALVVGKSLDSECIACPHSLHPLHCSGSVCSSFLDLLVHCPIGESSRGITLWSALFTAICHPNLCVMVTHFVSGLSTVGAGCCNLEFPYQHIGSSCC